MNKSLVCHISPKGGVDDRIAKWLDNGISKEEISTLRGMYDMEHKEPLISDEKDISDIDLLKAATTLQEYKHNQAKRHEQQMKSSTKHIAKTFVSLYQVDGWNQFTRRNRINMVAALFSSEVSRRVNTARQQGIPITREQIVNGYKANGQYHDGQLSVFETVFDKLVHTYNNARKIVGQLEGVPQEKIDKLPAAKKKVVSQAQIAVREYPKILANWSALTTFARMTLRDTEGLKLGVNNLEYAAPATPDNFSMDAPLEDTYNMEESVREAWMVHQAETSAFGSLGTEVRRFFSTITDVDSEGNEITDDLGFTVKMDPIETHQYLADILRGITSESGMIRKLRKLSENDKKVGQIFKALANASKADLTKDISDTNKPTYPVILTQLLEDMHKNMVPYTALLRSKAGRVFVKLLNRQNNPLRDEFALRMELNQRVDPSNSIFDENGVMNWEKFAQWYEESRTMLPLPDKKDANAKNVFENLQDYGGSTGFYSKDFTKVQRIDFIRRAANSLGIPMSEKSARRIYNNAFQRKAFLTALQEFRIQTRASLGTDMRKALDVIVRYDGIRPSVNTGQAIEQREEYDAALNSLKSIGKTGMTYKQFLSRTYGQQQSDHPIGSGTERVNKMLDIISSVSFQLKTERRVSWFDRHGKANSRYSDRTPSYMGDLVDKLHEFVEEGDGEGLRNFIMDKWGNSSFFYDAENKRFRNRWLDELYNSITTDSRGRTIIDQNALAKVFHFDEFLGSNINKNVSIFENFTTKQHAEAMVKQFLQLKDDSRGKSPLAKYPSFILGDSGVQMFFTARHYSKGQIMTGLKDVVDQEVERIKYVRATNKVMAKFFADKNGYIYSEDANGNTVITTKDGKEIPEKDWKKLGYRPIKNFSDTADEFTMLKFLNKDSNHGKYWKIATGNREMSDGELSKMSKEDAMQEALSSVGTDAMTEAIQIYMDDAEQTFKRKLASLGILTEVKGEGGSIKYTDPSNYFASSLSRYHNNVEEMVDDFFWNIKYATIEQLQMFTVDPAFYDHRYPVKDLQKRYKEIYAPGKGVSLEARDYNGELYAKKPYETAVYFDDIEVSAADVNPYFMDMIEKLYGKNSAVYKAYTKNSLTDGQGYRTLESYRTVRGMAGEWTLPMENAYKKIQAIRNRNTPLTDEDIREIASLATIFQPIKPYMFTLEKVQINDQGDMALIPVQHKYAEIVLIPELMKDGKLKDMALWMENHKDADGNAAPIDLVASTACVKVGSFGSTVLKGMNTTEQINSALDKAYIHNLSWSDYRIQQGVPEHLNHAQLFGTQPRKLFFDSIRKQGVYKDYLSNIMHQATDDPNGLKVYLPGMGNVHLTGNNLISFYNCLIMANLFGDYDKFASQTATNQALSDKMIQNVVSNSNQSEDNAFGFSIIDEGEHKGEFLIPLAEPGMEHDSSALLFSLFKKAINKQNIKGGSAVQASAMGLSGYEDVGDLFEVVSPEKDNVLYDEIEMPWNVSYTSATGKNVPLKYEDWCNPDGTLKMSDKIVYGDDAKEYLSWPVSGRNEYGRAIDPNKGYYIPLIEEKYRGILDIIAYRIPTERDYSMINCKVFRFSNPLAGGTLKVPSSRTTTAGFDFDIDKLYFFMREFAQTHLSQKDQEYIWDAIYTEYPEWKQALKEQRDLYKKSREMLGGLADLFENSETMRDIANADKKIKFGDRLYHFWEQAGLEGTPEEAFTKYLEDHRADYPVFDTYDLTASPLNPVKDKDGNIIQKGNSRVARNNMLMDLIRQRLQDKETLKARYTPGGFRNNSDAALRMRVLQFANKADITTNGRIDWAKVDKYVEDINKGDRKDPEPEYDVSDPTTILVYNQQNQVAGKLIGIFANQNTNHVYASVLSQLALREPIRFGDHTTTGLRDMLHAPEGVDVNTNVAEYLAASVDAVKDPVLNYLNLNTVTADAGAMLARTGYSPREIGLLFNQPIIKELCNYKDNENVSADVATLEMLRKYGGRNASMQNIQFDPQKVSTDILANNILKQRDIENGGKAIDDFNAGQLQVLYLFNELMADSKDVSSLIQSTRFTAANSVGSTWGEQFAQQERIKSFAEKYGGNNKNNRLVIELFDKDNTGSERVVTSEEADMSDENHGILNLDSNLLELSPEDYMAQMSRNPFAFEQCMMDMGRKAQKKLFGRNYPYFTQLYDNMRETMKGLTKYGNLDADTINSLHREFITYMLSKQKGSSFDGEAMHDTNVTNREYYGYVYPVIIEALKAEGAFSTSPFFNALTVTGDADSSSPIQITVSGMGGLQSRASNTITEMWADAFNSQETVHSRLLGRDFSVSQLARDFYFYNFYKLGYNFHPTSSMSLAPTLLKLSLRINTPTSEKGYIDFIDDIIKGNVSMDNNDLVSFAKQSILNHLDNRSFVFTPKDSSATVVNSKAYNTEGKYWNDQFTVSVKELGGDNSNVFLLPTTNFKSQKYAFRPVLAIERNIDGTKVTQYYMASYKGERFNVTDKGDGSMTYKRVYAQGSKGQQLRYFGNTGFESFQEHHGEIERNAKIKFNDLSQITDDTNDGTPSVETEDSPIVKVGDKVDDMFTDKEWQRMFDTFKGEHPELFQKDIQQNMNFKDFKGMFTDELNQSDVDIINDLYAKIRKGDMPITLDENGKEIKVCG